MSSNSIESIIFPMTNFPVFSLLKSSLWRGALKWAACVITVAVLLAVTSGAQVPVILSPVPKLQFFDSNGKVLAFGCVFSYQTLSTTPLGTYTDYSGNTLNTNPVILTSGGFVGTGGMWLKAGQAYRLVVKSAGGTNCASGSTISTVDGIGGGTTTLTTVVTYSATPIFPIAAQNQLFEITLTGDATSQPLTAVGIIPPSVVTWEITQDGSGGHLFTWPVNTIGGATICSTAACTTQQTFIWNGSDAIALGPATYTIGPAYAVTDLYDYGLSASSTVCTDANKKLVATCSSILSVTYNGQTVAPGGSGNVNAGAAAHSMALNQGNGSAITGVLLTADQVPVGKTSADPTGSSIPNCTDTGGNHLNYASGGTFSCGTSSSFGTAIRVFSVTGCTPASSTDSQCSGTITVSPAFADANYIPQLTANGNGGTSPNLVVTVNGSLSSNSIPYVLSCSFDCGTVNAPTIYVTAIHP